MPHYVGLDVSKATTSICVVDGAGERVAEGVVETEPHAIIAFLRGSGRRYARIGIEAMSMTPSIYEPLGKAGLPIICIENRLAHNVLSTRRNKTDRNDARGIAEIMRAGIYRQVHVKTRASLEVKTMLAARRFLVSKRRDIDNLIGAFLLQDGQKLPRGSIGTFLRRVEATSRSASRLVQDTLQSLLELRSTVLEKIALIEARLEEIADADPICRRLTTAPGVGKLTALIYRVGVDIPERFAKSRLIGAHFGMTPTSKQSGNVRRRGRITRCGDGYVRSALHNAARAVMRSRTHPSALKIWGKNVERKRGYWKALVAVARKLAVILHRMWVTETDFNTSMR
jgi:transposase